MNFNYNWLRRLASGSAISLCLFVLTVIMAGAAAPPDWNALTPDDALPNHLLVRINPGVTQRDPATGFRSLALHQNLGATVLHEYRLIPWQVVSVPSGMTLAAAAAEYLADPNVDAVEPNYIWKVDAIPNDPRYSSLWGMDYINAPAAWDITTGSDDIIVGVIDTGVRYTHEDLAANMWVNPAPTFGDVHGASWVGGFGIATSGDPMDDQGHGTHVAGTVGAVGNNMRGVVGVNWRVKIMALKFLSSSGRGATADAVSALEYAILNGANLTCNSWGGGAPSDALEEMIEEAAGANQLFVAAAGNDNLDNDRIPHYPSSYPNENIIAVASVSSDSRRSDFSNYGATSVHIAAPGDNIGSCTFESDSSYGSKSGTSMACPHVAGAAALLLSLYPAAPWEDLRAAILESARPNSYLDGVVSTGAELDLLAAAARMIGTITLDRLAYRSDATVNVRVFDAGVPEEEFAVFVDWRTTRPDDSVRHEETYVDLFREDETPLFNGDFTLQTDATAVHGDLLTVLYETAEGEVMTATAPIDDVPPQIMNLRFTELMDDRLELRWETDEPATTCAALGTNVPPSEYFYEDDQFKTEHVVTFTGLPPFMAFNASVWGEDYAGNIGSYPQETNSQDVADYVPGSTRGLAYVSGTDYEAFVRGWQAVSLSSGGDSCWEYGIPSFGPPDATRCWGTKLNDSYPPFVNAALVSEPFTSGDYPSIHFSQWCDIIPWGLPEADLGRIEVLVDGGWVNVTPYLDSLPGAQSIAGYSAVWRHERIRLPHETFGNKILQVRFHFLSGGNVHPAGNPAGWFIDNFRISEVQNSAVVWTHLDINDDQPHGDGDGFAEVGETLELNLTILNLTGATLTNLTGTLVARAEGDSAIQPQLLNGSPAMLEFGDVPAETFAAAIPAAPLLMKLPEDMAPGTVISLLQTLVDSTGRYYETRRQLVVAPRSAVSGIVLDTAGDPIEGADVTARYGFEDFSATTDAAGLFEIQGLREGILYEITASSPAGSQLRLIQSPASGLEFRLGGIADGPFNVPSTPVMPEVDPDDPPNTPAWGDLMGMVTYDIMPDNDNHPGSPVYGEPLEGALVCVEDVWGYLIDVVETDDSGFFELYDIFDDIVWVYVLPPEDRPRLVSPPGEMLELDGFEWLDFTLRQDGPDADEAARAPRIVIDRIEVDDSQGGDGDGTWDPGETIQIRAFLRNIGAATASSVTGQLLTPDMGVSAQMTAIQDQADQPVSVAAQTNPLYPVQLQPVFEVQVHPDAIRGSLQRFTLMVTDSSTTPPRQWPIDFVLQVDPEVVISGSVEFADGQNTEENFLRTRVELNVWGDIKRVGVNADGTYSLSTIWAGGEGTVAVVEVPFNYALPAALPVGPLETDILDADFTVYPIPLELDPAPVPANLHFTVTEGHSATGTLSLLNSGTDPLSFTVGQRYKRKLSEVDPPPSQMAAMAAPPSAPPTVDWSNLSEKTHSTEELVVRFAEGVSRAEQRAILQDNGLEAVFFFDAFPAALARRIPDVPAAPSTLATMSTKAVAMEEDPRVTLVAPDSTARPMSATPVFPDDELFETLYGLYNDRQTGGTKGMDIGAPWVWSQSTGSRSIVVAVCDTGVTIGHEDLRANIWHNPYPGRFDAGNDDPQIVGDAYGWNFYEWNSDVGDYHGHGTHVAGTIGAVGDNGVGVAGVNWNVSLMVCRLAGMSGDFTSSARIAKAIEYAVANGAHLSNHSWGGPDTAGLIASAVEYARANNHLIIAAAGNEAADLDEIKSYPAYYSTTYDNVITVAASDHDGELAYFSNFGAESVQIAAPGQDINSTYIMDYTEMSGTSMAAPHVAGAAALLWSIVPDAPYSIIKAALLEGARQDPRLAGWVSTSGHLDLRRSAESLGFNWLSVTPEVVTLNPGETIDLDLVVNDPPVLQARVALYEADIVLNSLDGSFTRTIPLSVKVNKGVWLEVESVRIENLADYNDDLPPSPGDQVKLWVTLKNRSSASLLADNPPSVTAQLSGGGASLITQDTVSWEYFYGGAILESENEFLITLDSAASGDSLLFDLHVTALGQPGGVFTVEVPLTQGAVLTGIVLTAPEQAPVADALVEIWGTQGASTFTFADGMFHLRGLPDGAYHARATPPEHQRSLPVAFTVAGSDLTLPAPIEVQAPVVTLTAAQETLILAQGLSAAETLQIDNGSDTSAGPFSFNIYASPLRRVALISDSDTLSPIAAPLEGMGFEIERFTNNFTRIQTSNPYNPGDPFEIVQEVRYSNKPALISGFDAVILDMSSTSGVGRVFSEAEAIVLGDYAAAGGRVIVTGANPLSLPDNQSLTNLLPITSFDRATNSLNQAAAVVAWEDPFISLAAGDSLSATGLFYDEAAFDADPQVSALFTVGDSVKLLRAANAGGGAVYLWTGNTSDSDWDARGVWQDVLRGILWRELVRDGAGELAWLSLSADAGTLAVGAGQEIELGFDTSLMAAGLHEISLLVIGNYPGSETRAVRLALNVSERTMRAYTTGQVTDWRGEPLRGSGGPDAALFQLIWAGPDGQADSPGLDGSPTGDDVVLAVYASGLPHERFGIGHEETADSGRFDQLFRLAIPQDAPSSNLYVRAWDAPSYEAALVYGDSYLYEVENPVADEHDFGSWSITNVMRYARDSNGDGLPDGWLINNRPDLDPRSTIPALGSDYEYAGKIRLPKVNNRDANPVQVAVTDNLVFVLDKNNSCIVVYDRHTLLHKHTFGGTGPGDENLSQPEGMALDPRPGQNRLAVTDTNKHKIKVLTFNPVTGEISFAFAFGSQGSAYGQFKRPQGIAIERGTGNIFVADTENKRIQGFSADGDAPGGGAIIITGTGNYEMYGPRGIAVDPDVGIFVADDDAVGLNYRILHFDYDGTPLNKFGSYGTEDGLLRTPLDVRIWRHVPLDSSHEPGYRLAVADSANNRIQIFNTAGLHLLSIGVPGQSGASDGDLALPAGSFPLNNTNVIYVADTGHKRVQWFNVFLDADGDGMDDFWEDLHGLDPYDPDDALEDPDGDGLSNLGEYQTGNDPHNPDTDGDGIGDLDGLYDGLIPPDNPPLYVSLTADRIALEAGEKVVLTAVVSPGLPPEAELWLTLTGASPLAQRRMQTSDGTTFIYTHQTLEGELGWTDGALFSWYVSGQDYAQPQLFELVPPPVSFISLTAHTNQLESGATVVITAVVDNALPLSSEMWLTLTGASPLPATLMQTADGLTFTYSHQTGEEELGWTDGEVFCASVQGQTFSESDLFELVSPDEPLPPMEPFPILAISVDPPLLTWEAVIGGKYRIERTMLLRPSPIVWTTVADNITADDEAMTWVIPADSEGAFFRVVRTE